MRALNLIIKREYLTRVRKKSFLILTLLLPILFIGIIFVPLLLSGIKDSETKRIVVIDATGKYAPMLRSSVGYSFDIASTDSEEVKSQVGKSIFGILQITDDLASNPEAATFLSEKQIPIDLLNYVNTTCSEIVKEDKLHQLTETENIDPQIVTGIQSILKNTKKISVKTFRWGKDGSEKETSTSIAASIGTMFTLLMYMFILMYGAMVMNGVVEEKTNRIVEVMISAVRPFDLMMGKIIGIGLTGLTQLSIWFIVITVLLSIKSQIGNNVELPAGLDMFTNFALMSEINWGEILFFFFILFVGGYLIYASLFAMFGAAVDSAQDTQQFVMPVTLIFIFALYAGMYSIQNPDGPLAFWCSMIPLTSPIVMMVRIPFDIPLWEKIVSVSILYATIFVVVAFAAKIYRVGILMYGKKPSIKEILKWFSYN